MKQVLSLVLFIMWSTVISAQVINANQFLTLTDIKPGQSELIADGYFYTASNALNNEFLNTLYKGNFIDNNLKSSVKLSDQNYFGAENVYNLQYRFRADSLFNFSNATLGFSLSNHFYSNIAFSDDYFTLIFYGNSAISQADLSGFDFDYMNYQKFSIHFSKGFESEKWLLSSALSWSAVKGQKFYSIKIDDGHFHTIGQGLAIEAELDFEFRSSDTTKFDFADFNGLGAALNLFFSLKNKSSGNMLLFELTDFGGITWNDQSLHVDLDTTLSFNGQDINNLLDYSFTSFSELNEDSLRQDFYYSKSENKELKTKLPAKFGIHYLHHINSINSHILIGGQSCFFEKMYSPFMYARCRSTLRNGFSTTVQLAHGGFSETQIGLGMEKVFYDRVKISVFSANIPGFFNPSATFAQHLRAVISYKFG